MRVFKTIINIFVVFVFALTSVLQFHQHDCDGNIHLHLTTLNDLAIGSNVNSCECHKANVPGQSSENHTHGEGSCSMHIADYKASEYSEICDDSPISLLDIFIAQNTFAVSLSNEIIEKHTCLSVETVVSKIDLKGLSLRAPPICV